MAAYVNQNWYKSVTAAAQSMPPPQTSANIRDDYEKWYTEPGNLRMLLALKSGIESEISWSLDRLCRLSQNDQFLVNSMPGLADALLEWPQWYLTEGIQDAKEMDILFSPPPSIERKRRNALESLFILRNAAFLEGNARELAENPAMKSFMLLMLHKLRADNDEQSEVLLNALELLQSISSNFAFIPLSTPLESNPIPPLIALASQPVNRSLIIASLTCLTQILSSPSNFVHFTPDSPAFLATIKFLPLISDQALLEASLSYLYVHLSQPAMVKAFLLDPQMPSTLKLLVNVLLSQQIEESVTTDVGGTVYTVPSLKVSTRIHEATKEELDRLNEHPEPQRCYEWMKAMFIAKAEGEMTQVDFWNLYKDSFLPYVDQSPLLVASDVIKNVSVVFSQAQAMVLPGPPPTFIVRGVDRRRDEVPHEAFKCLWDRTGCGASTFQSAGDLFQHLLQDHLAEESQSACLWGGCKSHPVSKSTLRSHVLTHFSGVHLPEKSDSQSDSVTLPFALYPYPNENPTVRPAPPPPKAAYTYMVPKRDAPTVSLTALLCIRILFHASFVSADTAPRLDADHFGFPGVVDELMDEEGGQITTVSASASDQEGERQGRKAFVRARTLMEGVRMADETLMGWITEMVDAGIYGTS